MTLTILNVEQRSPEWYEARRGIVTASAVGKLITVRKLSAIDYACPACEAPAEAPCISSRGGVPMKSMHKERTAHSAANKSATTIIEPASNEDSRNLTAALAAERISGYTDATWVSVDMMRGQIDEPRAVDAYAAHFKTPVETCGLMVREFDGFTLGYSPDGLVGEDGLLEVKSRRQRTHVQTVVAGSVPIENMAQLQGGLMVSGRKWVDYLSFCGGLHLYPVRIYPDARWQKAIAEACRRFEANASELVALYTAAINEAGTPLTERIDYNLELVV